jgi:hypothetical protein
VCCLFPLVYTCEYVIYIMHMLVKIPYYLFVLPHILLGFGFRLINLVSGIHRFDFGFVLSPEPVFGAVSGFVFGFGPRRLHPIRIRSSLQQRFQKVQATRADLRRDKEGFRGKCKMESRLWHWPPFRSFLWRIYIGLLAMCFWIINSLVYI